MSNLQCLPEWELRRRVREEIQKGRLPPSAPSSMWGGPGSGLRCAVCDDPIRAVQIEYEVADSRGGESLRFHTQCHAVWQLECAVDSRAGVALIDTA